MHRRAGRARRWTAPVLLWLLAAPAGAREASDPETPAGTSTTATGVDPSRTNGEGSAAAPATSAAVQPSLHPAPAATSPAAGSTLPLAPAASSPVVDPPVWAPPAGSSPSVDPPVPASPAAVTTPESPARPVSVGEAREDHSRLGFFVHADLGAGYLRTTGSRGGASFATQGGALGVGIALGWAPDEAWALGLEFWSWRSLADSGLGPNTSVELQALGLNVTRYLVPDDVFASIVVSGTRLAITDAGESIEYDSSDIGFGFKVLLGKEWHITPWLGLGLAGELFLSVNRAGGETLRTLGAGLVFSCTGR